MFMQLDGDADPSPPAGTYQAATPDLRPLPSTVVFVAYDPTYELLLWLNDSMLFKSPRS